MAQGISRRKYSSITKYLTQLMQDKSASQRSRMAAAMRLSDIYLTADARAEKQADRAYRQQLRAAGQDVPEPVETPEPQAPDAITQARQFLARHRASAEAPQSGEADGE
jgi:hypothetical protein